MEHTQIVYLDNSSTTKPCSQAVEKVVEMMTEHYGNPSSLHTMGFKAEQEMTVARTAIADALGGKPQEITFTSGGTEANNLAIFGAVQAKKRMGNRVVTTAIEHPSVLNVMKELEKQGLEIIYLKPDEWGHISPEQIFQAVTKETILVSMMAVNNEVGTVLPVEAVANAIARAKSPALLHVDAVQAFGKINLRPQRMKIDLMTVSAHKIHGPKGVGALYKAQNVRIPAHSFGGGQEKDLRPGTESTPFIAGFGAAVKSLPNVTEEYQKIEEMNRHCRKRLLELDGVVINSPEDALPYIINFSTCGVRAETMVHHLATHSIFVSSGSACSKAKPSHVLEIMNLSKERILTSLRVSFSRWNTKEEIDQLIQALKQGNELLAKK